MKYSVQKQATWKDPLSLRSRRDWAETFSAAGLLTASPAVGNLFTGERRCNLVVLGLIVAQQATNALVTSQQGFIDGPEEMNNGLLYSLRVSWSTRFRC